MKTNTAPYTLNFNKIGHSAEGYMAISEFDKDLPFLPKRAFWTYFTPNEVVRGRHAHHKTEMVLIALNGRIDLEVETLEGETSHFVLDRPETGVFLPVLCWHTMQYSHNAVQLVFTSTLYDPEDYIRSYEEFVRLKNTP
jgi:dTDP-4-dehydrorhamnose 3,5-epimerase-like enzyme